MTSNIVQVKVLPTGTLALPRRWILSGRDDDNNIRAPDFSFLVEHPSSGDKVMFDLGFRKDLEAYPPPIQSNINVDFPECPEDAAEILAKDGVKPQDIKTVIFSHVHHDHVGDISKFPNSELILGPGTKALFPGYPENPKSAMLSAFIQAPSGKVREISSSEWQNIEGIWPRGIDFFGDGSFYLLDAPGHLPGHIMALARTGEDEYVLMGGDACHDPLLFVYPEKYDISEKHGPGPVGGMHRDPTAARQTIAGIKRLHDRSDVLVIMAHDYSLQEVLKTYPKNINGWRKTDIKQRALEICQRIEKEDLDRHRQWLAKGCCCNGHKKDR